MIVARLYPVARIFKPTPAVDNELVFETPKSRSTDCGKPKTGMVSFEGRRGPRVEITGDRNHSGLWFTAIRMVSFEGRRVPRVEITGDRNGVSTVVVKDKH